jgi:hypothetical protein
MTAKYIVTVATWIPITGIYMTAKYIVTVASCIYLLLVSMLPLLLYI